ncbi:MAG: hypothetical protein FJW39_13250 [Acidobacteria bacterium]|nr:hypothetical protein [Acidobacteriota bacterium]
MITRRALAALPFVIRSVRAADARRLQAGAAMANITPALGASLAGGMRNNPAKDVHDELHARALVLDNGTARIAVILVDSCAVPREIIDPAKRMIADRAKIPASHTLVAATHSHSAPAATHLFQSRPDPRYVEFLTGRIADAAVIASNRLRPAQIGWGIGTEPRALFNRRWHTKPGYVNDDPFDNGTDTVRMNPGYGNPNITKPEGPIDPDLGLIVVKGADERVIAVIGNYALHYVGGVGGGAVSADYFPVWGRTLLRLAGVNDPGVVTMMSNACSGNLNNADVTSRPVSRPPYGQIEHVAALLGPESLRVWRSMKFEPWVELKGSLEEFELGVRLPGKVEVERARKLIAGAPAAERAEDHYSDRKHIYARETLILNSEYFPSVRTVVQALRIGRLGIPTLPGEAFCELGLEIKKAKVFAGLMPVELANSYNGYIPTPDAHRHGGYETWRAKSSYLETEAATKLVAAAVRRLGAIA